MATATSLRNAVAGLSATARRDLSALWRQVESAAQAETALQDILPALVATYGSAASTLAAEWYDDLRAKAGVVGRFTAIPAEIPDPGTQALVGWAATEAGDYAAFQSLVEGGMQRRIANHSRLTVAGSSVADPRADGWQRQAFGGCAFCQMVAGRGAVFSEASADFASHDNCFPAGTLVTGPSVELGYRRWYEGELVVLGIATGQELAVTPNHPVLTRFGWKAAGLLGEGDEVVQRSGADLAALNVPHEHDVPTPIEDVWGAASVNVLRSVPVSAENFHGDFGVRNGDVDVVATDRFLADVLNTYARQQATQGLRAFARATSVLSALASERDGFLPPVGALAATDRSVRGLGLRPPLLGRHALGSEQARLTPAADAQTRIAQPSRHNSAADTEVLGHLEHAVTPRVGIGQTIRGIESVVRRMSTRGTRYHPVALQGQPQGFGVVPELGRDLTERLAGGVESRRVIEIRRVEFAGHVFNLQTTEGWYSANGTIVSNCNCVAVPAFEGAPRPVKPYTPSARSITDADRARVRDYLASH